MTDSYEAAKFKYLKYLKHTEGERSGADEEIRTTPLLSLGAKDAAAKKIRVASSTIIECENDEDNASEDQTHDSLLTQYGLLGYHVGTSSSMPKDEPIFINTRSPHSTFICGSQGSGKSYTLNVILQNYLLPDTKFGTLTNPVAGLAFHYDADCESVAETAALCSRGIKTRVLVSRSNFHGKRAAYERLPGAAEHLTIQPLIFDDSHINIDRMHKLMAFSESEGSCPLYMSVVQQILRTTAMEGKTFDFRYFKLQLEAHGFAPAQKNMLDMRMGLLESFMGNKPADGFIYPSTIKKSSKTLSKMSGTADPNLFKLESGTFTIVDLSDSFVDAATVCVLFEICLSLAKENRPDDGLVVTLDEAHKYLNKSTAAANFTERLLTTIREQRHNATRVVIATQEPTISENLLDLCSTTIVHRFTSPEWFAALKRHLAGASGFVASAAEQDALYREIVALGAGESFVFSPASFLLCDKNGSEPQKLGEEYLKMKTRWKPGEDHGMSVLSADKVTEDDEVEVVDEAMKNMWLGTKYGGRSNPQVRDGRT